MRDQNRRTWSATEVNTSLRAVWPRPLSLFYITVNVFSSLSLSQRLNEVALCPVPAWEQAKACWMGFLPWHLNESCPFLPIPIFVSGGHRVTFSSSVLFNVKGSPLVMDYCSPSPRSSHTISRQEVMCASGALHAGSSKWQPRETSLSDVPLSSFIKTPLKALYLQTYCAI